MLVFFIEDAIARHAGSTRLQVWQSLKRGYVRGLNLDHSHVELEKVIGKDNLYLLKNATPRSPELRLLYRRLFKLHELRQERDRVAQQQNRARERLQRTGKPDMTLRDLEMIIAALPANVDWQTFAKQGAFFGPHEYEKVLFLETKSVSSMDSAI